MSVRTLLRMFSLIISTLSVEQNRYIKRKKQAKIKWKKMITESIIDEEAEGMSITVVSKPVVRSREFLKTL